ncbi:MAG: cytochrome c3 family protein [Desulfuromonadales bacterium]
MMSQRWVVLAIVLLVATPSALYARWIKDKVSLETKEVGKVEFSHFNHLEAVGKNCPTCHNGIYHIVTKNNPDFTMKEMEAGKACGACHNGKNAFSVKEDCATCHGNGDIAYDTDAGKAVFSHEVHTAAFGCDSCHPSTFKAQKGANQATMEQMEQGASCGACHDGSTAFSVKDDNDCGKCHEM